MADVGASAVLLASLEDKSVQELPADAVLWAHLVSRAKRNELSGCLEWQRALAGPPGHLYGKIWTGKKVELAHRAAWRAWYGSLPDDKMVCHRCDNGKCIDPKHLFLGTQLDNMRDCASKRRTRPQKGPMPKRVGEQCYNAKLTIAQIDEMVRARIAEHLTYDELGRRFGVCRMQASAICRGLAWQSVARTATGPVDGNVIGTRYVRVKYTDDVVRRVQDLRASGALLREISAELGIPRGTVTALCAKQLGRPYRYAPSRVGQAVGSASGGLQS